jgi:hypothetical protein
MKIKDVERIKFSDVSIERDKYVTKSWPVSLFPDTPAGKLDTIEKLAGASEEVQNHLISLLDFPDFDAVRSRINAPYDIVNKQIELMLEYGKPQQPSPFMDPKIAQMTGTLALLEAEKDDSPEDRMDLLRDWLSQLDAIVQAKMVPPPGAPPPPPAAAGPEALAQGPSLAPDPSAGGAPPVMQ